MPRNLLFSTARRILGMLRFGRSALKEDAYPVDARGKPDLRYYDDSLEHYVRMHRQHLQSLHARKRGDHAGSLAFRRRAHAAWGLIARGPEAVPYALDLLRRTEPEAREDGATILSGIGTDERAVDHVLARLGSEQDAAAKDALILAVGRLGSRKAIPVLASIIRDAMADGDTRWTAVESLGMIVRKRFLQQERPLQAAIAWLDRHPG